MYKHPTLTHIDCNNTVSSERTLSCLPRQLKPARMDKGSNTPTPPRFCFLPTSPLTSDQHGGSRKRSFLRKYKYQYFWLRGSTVLSICTDVDRCRISFLDSRLSRRGTAMKVKDTFVCIWTLIRQLLTPVHPRRQPLRKELPQQNISILLDRDLQEPKAVSQLILYFTYYVLCLPCLLKRFYLMLSPLTSFKYMWADATQGGSFVHTI